MSPSGEIRFLLSGVNWHTEPVDGPTSKLIRQILGAVAEFDKAMTVAKLKGARDRIRRNGEKCEGRKSYAESNPEMIALAKAIKNRGGHVVRDCSRPGAAVGK